MMSDPGEKAANGPSGTNGLSMIQRAEVARSCLYCMGMPILTPERVKEIETSLPDLIALLRSMNHRPTLRNEILQQMGAMQPQPRTGDRGGPTDDRFKDLADLMASDLSVQDERVVAAVGIAVFMGAYAIAKYL